MLLDPNSAAFHEGSNLETNSRTLFSENFRWAELVQETLIFQSVPKKWLLARVHAA